MSDLDSKIKHILRNASVCLEQVARSREPETIRITAALRISERLTHDLIVLAEWRGENV